MSKMGVLFVTHHHVWPVYMKARYNFWNIDRPRNVSRRDYNHYQRLMMGTIVTSFFSFGAAILAITGAASQLQGTDDLPVMSIAEAIKYGQEQAAGSRTDAVKLQGFLQATAPVTMPGTSDQRVIRGRILLKAESGVRDELMSETLFEWNESAPDVFFTDGTSRLPIAFDIGQIPMQTDRRTTARVRYAGENARTSKPVAIEYGEQIYPLSQAIQAAVAEILQPHSVGEANPPVLSRWPIRGDDCGGGSNIVRGKDR
ncbi:MAG: hypothetical protein HC805_05490 [Alkalinema sp. RL_2_19]|nr:hypothetical protein [Alkalinema sp. RL_2_19]